MFSAYSHGPVYVLLINVSYVHPFIGKIYLKSLHFPFWLFHFGLWNMVGL